MNTTTLATSSRSKLALGAASPSAANAFVVPPFDTKSQSDAMSIQVWVPGVESAGVEISTRGTHLTITARKTQHVRPNFHAMHLESVQRDYQLSLRLGRSLDLEQLSADLVEGVLHIEIPVRQAGVPSSPNRTREKNAA